MLTQDHPRTEHPPALATSTRHAGDARTVVPVTKRSRGTDCGLAPALGPHAMLGPTRRAAPAPGSPRPAARCLLTKRSRGTAAGGRPGPSTRHTGRDSPDDPC